MKPNKDAQEYEKSWSGGKKPDAAILGAGMVKQAATAIGGRGYQVHVKEAEALGEKPMSLQDFTKTMK